jgi:hypothetical protein
MQRVVAGFGELLIGGDREKHVGRLARDLELLRKHYPRGSSLG